MGRRFVPAWDISNLNFKNLVWTRKTSKSYTLEIIGRSFGAAWEISNLNFKNLVWIGKTSKSFTLEKTGRSSGAAWEISIIEFEEPSVDKENFEVFYHRKNWA